jgi:carboxylate-amine ligase
MINVPGEIRWDVRPSPKFGTVENRTGDSVPTLSELGCLAALTQCLAEFIVRDYEDEHVVQDLPPWLVKENKWRAARYGMDAEIITPDRNARVRPIRRYIAEWIDRLLPVARDLECEDDLLFADELCSGGTSYERQREVAVTNNGDLRAVTARCLDETGAATPFA